MNSIQIILISCVVLITAYTLYNFKKNRPLVLLLVAGTVFIILFPDELTVVARKVGVRRGVDLLFYLTFTLLIFILVRFYKKIKYLERKLTDIVREMALRHAEEQR